MNQSILFKVVLVIGLVLAGMGCRKNDQPNDDKEDPPIDSIIPVDTLYNDINNTQGYAILEQLKGIWNGPVTSTTALGSYPEWIVDFRPISASQISAKNELDTLNDIHLSFFIAKYKGAYRMCFRNGGSFGGLTRVSYFLVDSVAASAGRSYYRFSEVVKGANRAYTEVVFSQDSLYIKSYTNNYNTQGQATLHMEWSAQRQDTTACQAATAMFNFPQKVLVKDFTTTFDNVTEAIYYSTTGGDPYPEQDQPHLGQTLVQYSFQGNYTPNPNNKVFLMLTTEPLINGFTINFNNLRTRSRYVLLNFSDRSFTFNYMHPGTYYLYALYDADGNRTFSSGDWVSANNTLVQLPSNGQTTAAVTINFTIP
jgi:hypothetical protein